MNFVNRDLEQLCRELPCQVQIPGICEGGPGEPSHSNALEHGHGMGIKSHSCFVASACRSCHRAIDAQGGSLTREQKRDYWRRGFDRTLLALWQRGLISVAHDCGTR